MWVSVWALVWVEVEGVIERIEAIVRAFESVFCQ